MEQEKNEGLQNEEIHQTENCENEEEREDHIIVSKLKIAVLILFIVLIPVLWFFGIGIPVDTDAVFVGDITETEDGSLEIPLHITSSALAFTVTTQQTEEDALILKPRASLVGLHHSGSTAVKVKIPREELSVIYLQGDDESDRLEIWRNEKN